MHATSQSSEPSYKSMHCMGKWINDMVNVMYNVYLQETELVIYIVISLKNPTSPSSAQSVP